MSSTAEFHDTMTVEDFLAFLERDDSRRKWQLLAGAPVMMINVTRRHSLITGNVFSALRVAARRRGCEAHTSDMLITSPNDSHFAAVPDVFVRCGPTSELSRKIDDPVLVVEVLSPSTMTGDRGYKFERYATIPSLGQVLFIYQNEIRVESWLRGDPEWSLTPVLHLDGSVQIPSLDESLALATIYDGISGIR